ncbi:MAG: DUF4260 domain-containing protein [Planctomycetota bacterium]
MSGPWLWLRIEGAAVLIASCWAYASIGAGWWLFTALFFVPDVSMVGYLRNLRVGAALYNLGHVYVWPVVLIGVGWYTAGPYITEIGLIWTAHIAFDRALGFGLKYPDRFRHTHLD